MLHNPRGISLFPEYVMMFYIYGNFMCNVIGLDGFVHFLGFSSSLRNIYFNILFFFIINDRQKY
ncbi:MAG: hypothetical protein AMDU1_APLC00013G0097 [Thermoplasmatales archaeon A-plasma]|nr:MAG: hypothetical protein AMDU1_APLC00013G0097 [Thermoplasmatales archaeon A-plasma]